MAAKKPIQFCCKNCGAVVKIMAPTGKEECPYCGGRMDLLWNPAN